MGRKKLLKKEKGITLIALVITIVVMLILAGVTINLTLGENGIFTTAQQAAKNYTDAQNKELSYLQGFTNEVNNIVNPAPLETIIKTENNINYTADGEGNVIPVPVGFSYLEGTKNTGFVIKNSQDGNEFVWIPVGNIANYKRVGWWRDDWKYRQTLNEKTGEITRADLGTSVVWKETIPTDEKDSVSTYGGFYIGRYEAGVINAQLNVDGWVEGIAPDKNWTGWTIPKDGKEIKLVVQKGQQVWNYITRDRALTEATNLYNKTEDNIVSKLCSSYAWDSALKFIEQNNKTYPTNSAGGNYNTASGGTGTIHVTGYHRVNNIYDMGGNTWEWTTESSIGGYPYSVRGGSFTYNASVDAAAVRGAGDTKHAYIYNGFRVALYL